MQMWKGWTATAGAPSMGCLPGLNGVLATRALYGRSSVGGTASFSVSGSWRTSRSCGGYVKPVASIHENSTTSQREVVSPRRCDGRSPDRKVA
jgi:hypothetical protein